MEKMFFCELAAFNLDDFEYISKESNYYLLSLKSGDKLIKISKKDYESFQKFYTDFYIKKQNEKIKESEDKNKSSEFKLDYPWSLTKYPQVYTPDPPVIISSGTNIPYSTFNNSSI